MIPISANIIFSDSEPNRKQHVITSSDLYRKSSVEKMYAKVLVVFIGIKFLQASLAYNGFKGRSLERDLP